MAISYQENIKSITNDVLLVTFSGRQQGLASLTIFEFTNFLDSNFPDYDKIYCRDEKIRWYNDGLTDITNNIEETVEFLRQKINNYNHVIFIGASMGGYAALLFGSILRVDAVIAFRPQTHIEKILPNFNPQYSDVKPFINSKTSYYLYGDLKLEDPDDIHSIEQCFHIMTPDVPALFMKLVGIPNFDLKEYKNSGNLKLDFEKVIHNV